MLSFLNIGAKFLLVVPAIAFAWTLYIGGPVKDLNLEFPGDVTVPLQEPIEIVADTIASIVDIMPWMEVLFDIFIWGLQFSILMMLVKILLWVVDLFTK